MKKSKRIEDLIASLPVEGDEEPERFYCGYFVCFNQTRYYEAHDVLEHLWMRTGGGDTQFYKGLIQLAGAFVHLQKQYLRPHHHKDKKRLGPAVRLFNLARKNLEPFRPLHRQLYVEEAIKICEFYVEQIIAGKFLCNPWRPETAPNLLPFRRDSSIKQATERSTN